MVSTMKAMLSQGWAYPWANPGLAERAARPSNKTRISRCICWRVPSSLYGGAAGTKRDVEDQSQKNQGRKIATIPIKKQITHATLTCTTKYFDIPAPLGPHFMAPYAHTGGNADIISLSGWREHHTESSSESQQAKKSPTQWIKMLSEFAIY